ALGLQADGDTAERAAGANRAAEAVDLPFRLIPDLFGCRLDMCLAVCDVVELVRPDRAVRLRLGELFGKPPRVLHIVVGILVRDRRNPDQRGSEQTERILLLLRLCLWDYDDRAEAHGSADHRQSNASVAGRAFDDRSPWAQQPAFNGIFDDVESGAVLHRLAGVHELRLAENGAA